MSNQWQHPRNGNICMGDRAKHREHEGQDSTIHGQRPLVNGRYCPASHTRIICLFLCDVSHRSFHSICSLRQAQPPIHGDPSLITLRHTRCTYQTAIRLMRAHLRAEELKGPRETSHDANQSALPDAGFGKTAFFFFFSSGPHSACDGDGVWMRG
jgi:hypothetical protein